MKQIYLLLLVVLGLTTAVQSQVVINDVLKVCGGECSFLWNANTPFELRFC
jgi:hypothetical protein